MKTNDCTDLVSSYLSWLKESFQVVAMDGGCEISTPFLDRHNDQLQIYVTNKDGGLRLSDDGYIIGDLESSGCALDTPQRKAALSVLLRGFGVKEQDGELFVDATLAGFPSKKHALIQAMIGVNDLFFTAKTKVASFFTEDVQKFLEAHEVRYSADVEFTGKTTFVHRFDFLIPKSRSSPERVIRAINRLDKEKAELLMFAWTDIKETRPPNAQLYAMLNDTEKPLSSDLLGALQNYDIQTLPWSNRAQHVRELVA